MFTLPERTQSAVSDKRALLASIRERMAWLAGEITAHGHSGRLVRRQALISEHKSLQAQAERLAWEIKRIENPHQLPRPYSASVDR